MKILGVQEEILEMQEEMFVKEVSKVSLFSDGL